MRQAMGEYITGAWTVVVVVVFAAKIKQSVTQMTDAFSTPCKVAPNRAQNWHYVIGH